MAKLRMTYKNLKALRKSKEYQAMLVDLVASGVISKSKAEDLLGFNIPANLIGGTESSETDNPIDDPGTGGEGSGSGSVDVDITVPGNTVTLLYLNEDTGEWETAECDLTNDLSDGDIIPFAKNAFSNDSIDAIIYVEPNTSYVEGESSIQEKYIALAPQPETFEPGMLIQVYHSNESPK